MNKTAAHLFFVYTYRQSSLHPHVWVFPLPTGEGWGGAPYNRMFSLPL